MCLVCAPYTRVHYGDDENVILSGLLFSSEVHIGAGYGTPVYGPRGPLKCRRGNVNTFLVVYSLILGPSTDTQSQVYKYMKIVRCTVTSSLDRLYSAGITCAKLKMVIPLRLTKKETVSFSFCYSTTTKFHSTWENGFVNQSKSNNSFLLQNLRWFKIQKLPTSETYNKEKFA